MVLEDGKRFIGPDQIIHGVSDKAYRKISGWKGMYYPAIHGTSEIISPVADVIKEEMIRALTDGVNFDKLRRIPNILGIYLEQFVSLHQNSIGNLARLAVKSAVKPDIQVRINIGFGGTVDPILARCPAYIVPAIKILEGLSGIGISLPEVRVFSTQSLIGLNGYKLEDVNYRTDEMFALLMAYIKKFHPEIQSRFSFEKPEVNLDEVSKLAAYLDDIQDPIIQKSLNEIQQMGFHHGGTLGRDNANLYAAAHIHPQFFQDLLPPAESTSDFIISLGGKPEIQFNSVRVGLAGQLKSSGIGSMHFPPSVHAIIGVGEKPVYYQDSWNDIDLEDFIRDPGRLRKVSPRVKYDLQVIFNDVGEEDYRNFLIDWRSSLIGKN